MVMSNKKEEKKNSHLLEIYIKVVTDKMVLGIYFNLAAGKEGSFRQYKNDRMLITNKAE